MNYTKKEQEQEVKRIEKLSNIEYGGKSHLGLYVGLIYLFLIIVAFFAY